MVRTQHPNHPAVDDSSRHNTTPAQQQQPHDDNDSLLSSCDQGGGTASEDTASLSATQDGSFLSSFSQDTLEDLIMLPWHGHSQKTRNNHHSNTTLNNNHNQDSSTANKHHHHPLRHRHALHHPCQHQDDDVLKEEGGDPTYGDSDGDDDHNEYYYYNHEIDEFHDPYYESENSKNHSSSLGRATTKLFWRRRTLLNWLGAFFLFFCFGVSILLGTLSFPLDSLQLRGHAWKLPSRQRTRKILQQLREPQPVVSNNNHNNNNDSGLTLRVSGQHVDLLHRAVEHYARCPVVTHIQINWTCPEDRIPNSIWPSLKHQGKLEWRLPSTPPPQQQQTTESDRHNIPTTAVLLLDEYVVLHCRDLDNAWVEWKQDPSRLVGLVPLSSLYQQPQQHHAKYTLVSDAAAIVHRFYWRSFQKATAAVLPKHCQHVALSTWVTALSRQSPIPMLSNVMLLPDFEASMDDDDDVDKNKNSNKNTPAKRPSSPVDVPDDCYHRAARAAGLSVLPETTGIILGGVTTLE